MQWSDKANNVVVCFNMTVNDRILVLTQVKACFLTFTTLQYFCINHGDQSCCFFQFESIVNVLLLSYFSALKGLEHIYCLYLLSLSLFSVVSRERMEFHWGHPNCIFSHDTKERRNERARRKNDRARRKNDGVRRKND